MIILHLLDEVTLTPKMVDSLHLITKYPTAKLKIKYTGSYIGNLAKFVGPSSCDLIVADSS